MIHGMWGGAWCWDNYKQFFEKNGYQCFTPTLRYHDVDPKENPHPELGTTSVMDYVSDLQKYILSLDQKPILMGHSMGGLLAQILGSQGLASSLVLLTPAPPRGIKGFDLSLIKSFWAILKHWGFWRNPIRPSFNEAVYSVLHLLPEKDQKTVYEKMVYESGRAATEIGLWIFDPNKTSKVDASSVNYPVLVVAGTKDRITPPFLARKIAEKYHTVSTYKEFENHAHYVIGEQNWENIAEFIYEWLNRVVHNPKY
jgi:pimeloyl-ACP methyl ester carboxylesterase